jgi:hypothetical protein
MSRENLIALMILNKEGAMQTQQLEKQWGMTPEQLQYAQKTVTVIQDKQKAGAAKAAH